MKHLFLPLTLLLSCAVAQSADLDKTDLTVNNRRKNLKDQNPPDDATAQVAVLLKTEQRPTLTALFAPTIIHTLIEKYTENNSDNDNEQKIINNIYLLHGMGAKLDALNQDNDTTLEVAYKKGSPNIIATLLKLGANPVPLCRSDIFNSNIESLPKFNAVIETISKLSSEKQKAIGEKAEQFEKQKEKAELKKQQEHKQSSNPIIVGNGNNEKNSVIDLF